MFKICHAVVVMSGILKVLWFPPPMKLGCHDITEILLIGGIKHTKNNKSLLLTLTTGRLNSYITQCVHFICGFFKVF
jgi:hypothetical protein